MKQFKKILALLLIVSLGTVVACSDDNDSNNNKNNGSNNQNDTGLVQNDTDNTEADADNTEADADNTPPDSSKQLKDLDAAELSALCAATNDQESVLVDPTNAYGKANCLLEGIFTAEYLAESESELAEICVEIQDECEEFGPETVEECVDNVTSCTATIAEFQKCTDDYIVAEQAFLDQFAGKTCSDYASETGMEALDQAIENYDYPASCEALATKCPGIFGTD